MTDCILNGELTILTPIMDNPVDRAWRRKADRLRELHPGSDVEYRWFGFYATIRGEQAGPVSYRAMAALLDMRPVRVLAAPRGTGVGPGVPEDDGRNAGILTS